MPLKPFLSLTVKTSHLPILGLDVTFAYVNLKLIYVEKHIKTQLTELYQNIMEQKCALERQILQNALSLSSIAPDEMAFRLMKSPGYTAVTAGEVIHLIKCIPAACKIRYTEPCFNELPVTCHNTSFFMLPRSRILVRRGTHRDCNELLPVMYQVEGNWFRIADRPMEALAPSTIQPLTQPSWKYVSPDSLATSGIYTNEDLIRLKNHIMFPVERPATLNAIARGAMGQTMPAGSISMLGLLDEQTLNKIVESTGQRLWQRFEAFGSASAGVLTIFMLIRLVKLIADTIIHGYALHSIYGWSIHLLGALWSSVTSLLLYLGRKSYDGDTSQIKDYKLTAGQEFMLIPPTEKASEPGATDSEETDGAQGTDTNPYHELRKYLHKNEHP